MRYPPRRRSDSPYSLIPDPARAKPTADPFWSPDDPARNRTAQWITIGLLAAGFVLLGLGGTLWAIQTQMLAWSPTPTATPTARAEPTATDDFRSTRLVSDFLTQQAQQIAQGGTPLPPLVVTHQPDGVAPPNPVSIATPNNDLYVPIPGGGGVRIVNTPAPGTTPNTIRLPIMAAEPVFTATPSGAEPAVVTVPPVLTPLPSGPDIATETPIPPTITVALTASDPSSTPSPTIAPPTATATIAPPTPSPTPSPLPSPTVIVDQVTVNSLVGFIRSQATTGYIGPSNLYTQTESFAADEEVRLLGRSASGEWVYVCCVDNNEPVWVRHAYAKPRNNEIPPGEPEDANPDDIRYLAVQPVPANNAEAPVPTPPPQDGFPMARYDRAASGRLPELPSFTLERAWPGMAQAAQAFVSPAIIAGDSVLAGSADNHLYSFDRFNGTQRWRYNVGRPIRVAPLLYDNEIFVADEIGNIIAFEDRGNTAVEIWRVGYNTPLTSFNVYSDTLFIATGQGTNHTLWALDRDNGSVFNLFQTNGPGLRYPVIGDQLVYAADSTLVALDVFTFERVWERGNIAQNELVNFQTDPLYARPGIYALAELYIVDGNNRIWCLNANTGETLWNYDNGEAATSLALTPSSLIVAGNGYIKAIARVQNDDDEIFQRWRASLPGTVLGGPLTDGQEIVALTQGGNVQYYDANNGDTRGLTIPTSAGGAAAVNSAWIYVPGNDGELYALNETAP